MTTFPLLNSGAVTQYPMTVGSGQTVKILRFLDNSEQRFLNQGRQFRRWQINLSQLTEGELFALEDFFEAQSADYSIFSFPDPFTGTEVPNCRLGDSDFMLELADVNCGLTSFWVIETNG